MSNEAYFKVHSEIKEMLGYIMKEVLVHKPENTREFIRELISLEIPAEDKKEQVPDILINEATQ